MSIFATKPVLPADAIALRGEQLARALNVSVRTLNNWRRDSGLPSRLIGGTRLYVVAEVMEWLQRQDADGQQRRAA